MSPAPTRPPRCLLIATLLGIFFFLCGLAIFPHIGVQTDEAIFTSALFDHPYPRFDISVFKKKVPLMVMSYLGATKAALYSVVFEVFKPSVYSLRIPALALAAATIPLFALVLRRALHPQAAWFGAALLAFDSSYLMASAMDWGPIVIQHVCLLAGLLGFLSAYQTGRTAPLAAGAWFFGTGLWDKALFLWLLSGLAIATVIVFFQQVRRFSNAKRIITAAVFFLLGALPLIIYNLRRPLDTFQGNAVFSTSELPAKLNLLPVVLNGSVFFGYLVEEDWAVKPLPPRTPLERASVALSQATGERRTHAYWYAFAATLVLSPALFFTPYRRPVAFCLVFLAVAWSQMLFTKGAGGGAHHTLLLWPLPHMLISIAIVWATGKAGRYAAPLRLALAVILCAAAFLVTNCYLSKAIRNGAPGSWTVASESLANELLAYQGRPVHLLDWGLLDNVRMFQRGQMRLAVSTGPLMDDIVTASEKEELERVFSEPGAVFVANTDERQVFEGVNRRLRQMLAELGYRRIPLKTIYDWNGRPCFEIFELTAIPPPGPATRAALPAR